MIIELKVTRDDGNVIIAAKIDARSRFVWNAPPDGDLIPENGPGVLHGLIVEPLWSEGGPLGLVHINSNGDVVVGG